MKRLLFTGGVAALLVGCGQNTGSSGGGPDPSTNVGMKPGVGRVDTGGGVTTGESPEKVRAAVSGTATYEDPSTNTAPATNTPSR